MKMTLTENGMNPDFANPEELVEKDERELEYEEIMYSLKNDINCFLWTRLPEDTTLDEAERIACKIYDSICFAWGENKPRN